MQDIPALLKGLEITGPILAEFVLSIPAEQMNRRRGEGFWTIAEHLSHLAQVQAMLMERLQRFMAEERPEFVPYIPADGEPETQPPQLTADKALEVFFRDRARQLALIAKADEAVWRKTAAHPEYALYSMHILVRHILMHDHWHMYRMEELWLTKDPYLTKLD
jgi:uncharacterized damage-inducible protein DinB